MAETENHTLELLKAIRNEISSLKTNVDNGFSTVNLRLASMEDKLSGETLYHLALRDEVADLKRRLDRVEAAQVVQP